jgi:prepilin-type N-terminal cleavage/methylation domain-containing protein
MTSYAGKTSRGFTLIEVIITIVVLAVLVAMMASYFGTSFYRSSSSIFNLKKSQELNQVMEKISAKYTEYPRWRKSTVYASGMVILATAASSNQGRFRSGGGTSGTTEPVWNNISAGATTTDGSITWTYVGPSPELAYRKWNPNTSYLAGTVIVPQISHWNGFK